MGVPVRYDDNGDRLETGPLLSRSTAGSQLGSMCECGRRTSSWIGLTLKVHGRDKTGVHHECEAALVLHYCCTLRCKWGILTQLR